MTPSLLDQHAWRLAAWRWHTLVLGLAALTSHHHLVRRLGPDVSRGSLGFALLGLVGVAGLLAIAASLAATWFDSRLGTLRRNQPRWGSRGFWFQLRRIGGALTVDLLVVGALYGLWLSWWPWLSAR